jgi:8-oxo-dGTP pyrophosphatase MutT (NUDIX family)
MIIGVSIILKYGNGLLFEIQKSHKWVDRPDGKAGIGIGCIGGGVEEGEGPYGALQREALEEIGCSVELEPCQDAFLADDRGNARPLEGPVPEGAAFLWEVDRPGYIRGARVAVFVGKPSGTPRPVDLPALLTMDVPKLQFCARGTAPLGDLLARGAGLQERQPIPRDAVPFPIGTPEILVGLLDSKPERASTVISFLR